MDQLREDTRERTWEDYVEDAGAVLAIGAGAAHFLRGGGYKQLTHFANFIAGTRVAIARGAFDDFNIDRGLSMAKKIAFRRDQMLNAVNIAKDPVLESPFVGYNILEKGTEYTRRVGGFNRQFKEEYGNKILGYMLDSDTIRSLIPASPLFRDD